MINTYNQYIALVKDIERERKEELYCQAHGWSLPPERFSYLTAVGCFASEEYDRLLEDIIFYENTDSLEVPSEEYFDEEEYLNNSYENAMRDEITWYNHARQLGWE